MVVNKDLSIRLITMHAIVEYVFTMILVESINDITAMKINPGIKHSHINEILSIKDKISLMAILLLFMRRVIFSF